VKPTPSKAKEFSSVMAFKEVHDCEIEKVLSVRLFAERIQRQGSDKETVGKVKVAVVSDWNQLDGPEKRGKDKQCLNN
jgi:hypothetical protein